MPMTGPYHLETCWKSSTGATAEDKETGRQADKETDDSVVSWMSPCLLVSLSPCLDAGAGAADWLELASGRSPRPASGDSSRSGIRCTLRSASSPLPRTPGAASG